MRESISLGLHFGLTSGVITTLGLIVGLHAGTHSSTAVIGGILTVAVADAMADALGIHISKEAENVYSERQLWLATFSTLLTKFFMALTFMLPMLLLPLTTAIVVSVGWGLGVVALLSFFMARKQGEGALKVVAEHLIIAVVVIALTHWLGDWVSVTFA